MHKMRCTTVSDSMWRLQCCSGTFGRVLSALASCIQAAISIHKLHMADRECHARKCSNGMLHELEGYLFQVLVG